MRLGGFLDMRRAFMSGYALRANSIYGAKESRLKRTLSKEFFQHSLALTCEAVSENGLGSEPACSLTIIPNEYSTHAFDTETQTRQWHL